MVNLSNVHGHSKHEPPNKGQATAVPFILNFLVSPASQHT